MLLRDRDVVYLPEASDLALHWLEYVAVDVLHACSALHCAAHNVARLVSIDGQQGLQIGVREVGERRAKIDVAGRGVRKSVKAIDRSLYITVGHGRCALAHVRA